MLFLYFFNRLLPLFSRRFAPTYSSRTEEAYLAQSQDIYDLERRIRELDLRRAGMPPAAFLVG